MTWIFGYITQIYVSSNSSYKKSGGKKKKDQNIEIFHLHQELY